MHSMNLQDGMQLILCAIILMAAFFSALGFMAGQMHGRNALPLAAAVLFGMFACIGGMLFMVFQITGESRLILFLLLMLLSLAVFGGELYFFMNHFREFHKGAWILLLTYVLAIALVTLFMRRGGSNHSIQTEILSGAGEAIRRHSLRPLWHFAENAALFLPLGVLFPMQHRRFWRWGYTVLNGMMLSVWIETIQMVTASGECDVNDILSNTLGAAAGYGIFYLCRGKSR